MNKDIELMSEKEIIKEIESFDSGCFISKKRNRYYYHTLGCCDKIGDFNALKYQLKCLRNEKNNEYYYKRKADLRDEAIDYQNNFYKHNYSYGELTMIESRFIELGRRYGLLREFKENGII